MLGLLAPSAASGADGRGLAPLLGRPQTTGVGLLLDTPSVVRRRSAATGAGPERRGRAAELPVLVAACPLELRRLLEADGMGIRSAPNMLALAISLEVAGSCGESAAEQVGLVLDRGESAGQATAKGREASDCWRAGNVRAYGAGI